jgi:hypothetical protein
VAAAPKSVTVPPPEALGIRLGEAPANVPDPDRIGIRLD